MQLIARCLFRLPFLFSSIFITAFISRNGYILCILWSIDQMQPELALSTILWKYSINRITYFIKICSEITVDIGIILEIVTEAITNLIKVPEADQVFGVVGWYTICCFTISHTSRHNTSGTAACGMIFTCRCTIPHLTNCWTFWLTSGQI